MRKEDLIKLGADKVVFEKEREDKDKNINNKEDIDKNINNEKDINKDISKEDISHKYNKDDKGIDYKEGEDKSRETGGKDDRSEDTSNEDEEDKKESDPTSCQSKKNSVSSTQKGSVADPTGKGPKRNYRTARIRHIKRIRRGLKGFNPNPRPPTTIEWLGKIFSDVLKGIYNHLVYVFGQIEFSAPNILVKSYLVYKYCGVFGVLCL